VRVDHDQRRLTGRTGEHVAEVDRGLGERVDVIGEREVEAGVVEEDQEPRVGTEPDEPRPLHHERVLLAHVHDVQAAPRQLARGRERPHGLPTLGRTRRPDARAGGQVGRLDELVRRRPLLDQRRQVEGLRLEPLGHARPRIALEIVRRASVSGKPTATAASRSSASSASAEIRGRKRARANAERLS
jgi:hypothetical protein